MLQLLARIRAGWCCGCRRKVDTNAKHLHPTDLLLRAARLQSVQFLSQRTVDRLELVSGSHQVDIDRPNLLRRGTCGKVARDEGCLADLPRPEQTQCRLRTVQQQIQIVPCELRAWVEVACFHAAYSTYLYPIGSIEPNRRI